MATKKPSRPFRHKPRHINFWHLQEFLLLIRQGAPAEIGLGLAVERWGLDPNDLVAQDHLKRLRKAWRRWAESDRWHFLQVIEAVAEAELAKSPAARRQKAAENAVLRKLGIDAISLAAGLVRHFGSARTPTLIPVDDLAATLVNCAAGLKAATSSSDKVRVQPAAEAAINFLVTRTNVKRFWGLLADIVGSIVRQRVSERTLRRYSDRSHLQAPNQRAWKPADELFEAMHPYIDWDSVKRFYEAGWEFLRRPV